MKFALIGSGLWGTVILRDLILLDNEVDVVETDSENAHKAKTLGARQTWQSIDQISDVQAIIIATPASTHAAIIQALDKAGNTYPIFCEKPLVDSAEQARKLLNRSGPPLFVMHIWRYHSGIMKLRELYQAGKIGTLTQFKSVRANWTSPRTDVNTLMNLAPHDLSILQFILGKIPPVVSAIAERIEGNIESCLAILKEPDGPNCIIEVSNRYAEKRREVRLHGTKAVLVLPDDTQGRIHLIQAGGTILAENVELLNYAGPSAMQQQLAEIMNYLKTGNDAQLCTAQSGIEVIFSLEAIRAFLN